MNNILAEYTKNRNLTLYGKDKSKHNADFSVVCRDKYGIVFVCLIEVVNERHRGFNISYARIKPDSLEMMSDVNVCNAFYRSIVKVGQAA